MPSRRPSNEQEYCWEQVLRTNPLFRVSHVFASPEQAERLLPLYALFSALEQLSHSSTELEVRQRKLVWWREECLGREPAESAHPILRELSRTGVAKRLDRTHLAQLFDNTALRLDCPTPADADEFESLCRLAGYPRCALELSMAGYDRPEMFSGASLRIGLAQLVRESTGLGGARRFWWLPLNLLARHGLSRTRLETEIDAPETQAVAEEALLLERSWEDAKPLEQKTEEPPVAEIRHLAVHSQLQLHAIRRLGGQPPSAYAATLRRVGVPELYQAWKTARRVNRQ